jgi:mono/diheme cytochrome c family protein
MKARWILILCLLAGSALLFARDGSWLRKVPASYHARVNPYAGNPRAAAAGKILFEEHCARCHGADARGRRGRPSLRSRFVEQTTDGDLAWILRNGQVWKGMPSWSSLPSPERWQIITYLRSLPPGPDASAATHHNGKTP